ncbi:hypothetical protein V2J09_003751 [Rumex salicifolius]
MTIFYQRGDIHIPSSKLLDQTEGSLRAGRRGRRLGRIRLQKVLVGLLILAASFSICMVLLGLNMLVHGDKDSDVSSLTEVKKKPFQIRSLGMRKVPEGREEGDRSSLSELKGDASSLEGGKSKPLQIGRLWKKARKHLPCDVAFAKSIDYILEPKDYLNFTQFSLNYTITEGKHLIESSCQPRFGGHQTLEEREASFYAKNRTLHCGFVQGPEGSGSTGFDLDEKDKLYMKSCFIAVSSCIFGSSDFLRRPTSKLISDSSKKRVCFVMFLDEQSLSKVSSEGHVPDSEGFIGLWRIVVVKNFPYNDMRKTGKVPKLLAHRLFPASRYSIWLDSKLRLNSDPLLILEFFLWRTRSEYAISNHYDRHCVWDEVLQNKRLNKYNHTVIDEQFKFYQSDGLRKFDASDPNSYLPSCACYIYISRYIWRFDHLLFTLYSQVMVFCHSVTTSLFYVYHTDVPEGSFIIRAHTPMSNLFSCLWFNEVDRFTSRDQLSFAYTYLKLRRMNPDKAFHLNMFKVTIN